MRTLVVALLALGCASEGGDLGGPPGVYDDEAEISPDRREVGVVELGARRCTGVLVTPYTVLTSADCLAGAGTPEDPATFSVGLGTGVGRAFPIADVRLFGDEREQEVAMALLSEAVPAALAVPARFSREAPAAGETVTRFGFDCIFRGEVDEELTKRKYFFAWGEDPGVCPSGVTFRGDGRVVQLADGILADVALHADALHRQILEWPAPLEAGDADGLLAWLRFDEGYVSGPAGMAAVFEGTDVVQRPRPLLTHRVAWTFSAWIRPAGMGGMIYSEGDPRVTLAVVLREDGGLALESWHIEDETWSSSTSSAGIVPLAEWSHVAISLDDGSYGGGKVKFYVNGQLADVVDGRASVSPWTVYAGLGDSVGAYHGGGQPHAPYAGELDEVRFHDRAIDAALLRDLTETLAP